MHILPLTSKKQNFSSFIAWKNNSGEQLDNYEIRLLGHIKDVLDNKQSKHINIIGEIVQGDPQDPNVKLVRFKTTPLLSDMVAILKQPNHTHETTKNYERHSRWFLLNHSLEWEAIKYLNRQINFIRYCANNPNHTSQLIIKQRGKN